MIIWIQHTCSGWWYTALNQSWTCQLSRHECIRFSITTGNCKSNKQYKSFGTTTRGNYYWNTHGNNFIKKTVKIKVHRKVVTLVFMYVKKYFIIFLFFSLSYILCLGSSGILAPSLHVHIYLWYINQMWFLSVLSRFSCM